MLPFQTDIFQTVVGKVMGRGEISDMGRRAMKRLHFREHSEGSICISWDIRRR